MLTKDEEYYKITKTQKLQTQLYMIYYSLLCTAIEKIQLTDVVTLYGWTQVNG